ncbi:MAG: hypothetical protein C5B47_08885 [Verrucomicrobia bacterium]|nr:MAG: hypothetical protein C5B47_08885 [Verrucomicrobiota bacterium]
MLEIPRSLKTIGGSNLSRTKVLGIGNAGVNLVDRLTIERSFELETVAINTDLQSLVSSVADSKIPIGEKATRGLGTGGDPEIGMDAAHESRGTLQAVLEDTALAIICAGLGGGTGSSVLPVLLEAARMQGTLTTAILTLPFLFEGRRRMQQAQNALEQIRPLADAILIFENDRMSESAQPKLGIGETFAQSDLFLTQAAMAIARLVSGSGPLQLTLGDLSTVLRPNLGISLFGFGRSDGEDRAMSALKHALESPLSNRGDLLNTAERLLIHIDGPSNLLLSEVEAIVQEVSSNCSPSTHILLGIANGSFQDSNLSGSLTVSLLGTCLPAYEVPEERVAPKDCALDSRPSSISMTRSAVSPVVEISPQPVPVLHPISEGLLPMEPEPIVDQGPEPQQAEAALLQPPPAVRLQFVEEQSVEPKTLPQFVNVHSPSPEREFSFPENSVPSIEEQQENSDDFVQMESETIETATTAMTPPPKPKQEILQFEPIARGRFEKSEPTIVNGEDLDVPTFLRMKIKMK